MYLPGVVTTYNLTLCHCFMFWFPSTLSNQCNDIIFHCEMQHHSGMLAAPSAAPFQQQVVLQQPHTLVPQLFPLTATQYPPQQQCFTPYSIQQLQVMLQQTLGMQFLLQASIMLKSMAITMAIHQQCCCSSTSRLVGAYCCCVCSCLCF